MKTTCFTASLVAALTLVAATSSTALARTTQERLQKGDEVILSLNKGQPQQTLERMRQEFPFLADATQGYALGDVWSRPGLDNRTRQLAAVAAFAAIGEPVFMKVHAGYALNRPYMVTVPAGFPKAIRASQVLSELFAEHRASGPSTVPGAPR